LFVDGEFYAEWQDLTEPLLNNDHDRFFAIKAEQNSKLRLSDVVVSEWNGMPDSARSMENEERDILLLANGTDRISGEVLTLEEDIIRVRSHYADLEIPVSDISEIHLATGNLAQPSKPEEDDVLLYLQPRGQVTLKPHHGNSGRLKGTHPVLSDLSFDLDYCYLIEFDPQSTIFDNWDHDF
jgi:hypothetical protein